MMKEGEGSGDGGAGGGEGPGGGGGGGGGAVVVGPTRVPPGKKLVLKRVITKTYPDGRVEVAPSLNPKP